MAWWVWVLIGWAAVAALIALPVGRALRVADLRERGFLPSRRQRVPVPPFAVVLGGVGVVLEAFGFALRAAGRDRVGVARLFSMDLPLSVPRMFVTALFAVAALAAFVGAGRVAGRRTWWVAVGLVAAVAAEVKGGGTVHVRIVAAVGLAPHPVLAALVSGVVVLVVIGALFLLSNGERRDRRRVLTAFALYGAAAGGLSSVSSGVGQATGSALWTAVATFFEESGEVLGALTVLVAVLAGVAPRLVVPASWTLRRAADAETVDAPVPLPAWATHPGDQRG